MLEAEQVTQDVGSRDQILREWQAHHQEEVERTADEMETLNRRLMPRAA